MTEQEILKRQEDNGNREFYLMLVGKFLHAYGHGAFALARATGYRVVRKHRRGGEVLTCGFPMERLDQVRQRLTEVGATVDQLDEKTFQFRNLDGTPAPEMICEPQPKPAPRQEARTSAADCSWLIEALRGYNLSMSTPMDAMLFIQKMQQRLKETEQHNNDDACESPAGHGLQE